MHQTLYAVIRIVGCCVDPDALAVRLADDQLFAPVAENIGAKTRCSLGRIAGIIAVRREQIGDGRFACISGHFGNSRGRIRVAVENFAF